MDTVSLFSGLVGVQKLGVQKTLVKNTEAARRRPVCGTAVSLLPAIVGQEGERVEVGIGSEELAPIGGFYRPGTRALDR